MVRWQADLMKPSSTDGLQGVRTYRSALAMSQQPVTTIRLRIRFPFSSLFWRSRVAEDRTTMREGG